MGFFYYKNLLPLQEIVADGKDLSEDEDQNQNATDYTQDDDNAPADNPPATAADNPPAGDAGDEPAGGNEEPTDYTVDDQDDNPPAGDAGGGDAPDDNAEPTDYTVDDQDTGGDEPAPADAGGGEDTGEPPADAGGTDAEPTDYTQDDTPDAGDAGGDNPPADDAGGDAPADDAGGDAGTTDYTQDDTAGGDAGGDDAGTADVGGGEGDAGATDYTQDDGGGEEGDNPEGGEEGQEGDQTDDQAGDDQQQPTGLSDELKDLEAQLFSNLTPEQISIKDTELKMQYIDLYKAVDKVLSRVSNLNKTDENISVLDFVNKKLSETKVMLNDYIVKTYQTNSYFENQLNLKHFTLILEYINKILEGIKEKPKDDEKSE